MGSVSASTQQSVVNQLPIGNPSLNLTAFNDLKTRKDFNFQTLHEAIGLEIEQDLKERRRLKELAQQPLIQF